MMLSVWVVFDDGYGREVSDYGGNGGNSKACKELNEFILSISVFPLDADCPDDGFCFPKNLFASTKCKRSARLANNLVGYPNLDNKCGHQHARIGYSIKQVNDELPLSQL